jgi:hypothetical protein
MRETRWQLVVCLVTRGNIDISGLISSFPHEPVRAWRTATRRRVHPLQQWPRRGREPSVGVCGQSLPNPILSHSSSLFLSSLSIWCGGGRLSRVSQRREMGVEVEEQRGWIDPGRCSRRWRARRRRTAADLLHFLVKAAREGGQWRPTTEVSRRRLRPPLSLFLPP